MKRDSNDAGFIALITAIILGVILMVVAISLSTTGYFTRGQVVDAEYKEHSRSLAEACVQIALLRLASNPAANHYLQTIGSDRCIIGNPIPSATDYIISTLAAFPATTTSAFGAITYLQIKALKSNLSIIEWKECPTSTAC
jgi:hypothetical protein